MQPVRGAQETGALGCIKGFGKGVAGVALKPSAGKLHPPLYQLHVADKYAGVMGLAGYSGKGMYEQVQKARGLRSKKKIREAQIAEGLAEWEITTEEGKRRILQKAKEELEEFDRVLGVVRLL